MSHVYHTSIGYGRPLVLIHGFCETGEIWRPLADLLLLQYNVIIPDLPGFGKSALPAGLISIDAIAGQMLDWLIPWHSSKPVIIGHSLGGYIALAMAKQMSTLFAGMGLFHSTAYADPPEKKENRNKAIRFVERHGVAAYTDSFVPGLFYRKDDPQIGRIKNQAAATQPDTLVKYLAAMRDRPSGMYVLEDFEKPVLFVGGDHDELIPKGQLREQSRRARHSLFRLMVDSGHMGMLENKPEALKIIQEFMVFTETFAPEK